MAGRSLPEGVVTLLMADIEGSTKLWEAQAGDMLAAISRYDELVASTVDRHLGVRPVEQGEGDSFVAAFAEPAAAVRCALDIQLRLGRDDYPFRVRMAVHTGEIHLRDEGNYVGSTINRCARIRAVAHGGQTVVSQVVHELVSSTLPAGAALEDVGHHRLRDLSSPEHLYRLRHPDLVDNDAPLASLDVVGHNLPIELTTFIGRHHELDAVAALVDDNRMVTLLGTGGCGKTRLSLQVGAQAIDHFAGGVWFIELASIEDPDLVPVTALAAIGGREQPGRELIDTLAAHITPRPILMILDNCEHVVDAAARLASTLLTRCSALKILASSREALGVPGELTFTVPSLSVPARTPSAASQLAESDAVELFVERASRARPDFALTDENAEAVAQICRRLDGIPLALELAAARMRVLSAEQISDALVDRFTLLTTGARTLLPRQQTLRASVDWSYELLSDVEQVALDRLSVFAGGFDLDAATEVIATPPIEPRTVLDVVASLVEKSLVLADQQGGAVRYRILETIRQYGADKLDERGERSLVLAAHRDFYRRLVRRAAAEEEGPDQQRWAARVRVELDNIRSALLSALQDDDGDALIELTCGTGNTWTLVGGSQEHRRWLDESVARAPADSPLLASATYQLGITDMFLFDIEGSRRHLADAIPLYRRQGDEIGALWAHAEWAWAVVFADGLAAGRPHYSDGIEAATRAGADGARFSMEYGLAYSLVICGHLDEGKALFERIVSGPWPIHHFGQWAKGGLAYTEVSLGHLDDGLSLGQDVLAYSRQADDVVVAVSCWWSIGMARLRGGDLGAARSALAECMRVETEVVAATVSVGHQGMAMLAMADGDADRAVALIDEGIRRSYRVSSLPVPMLVPTRAEAVLATGDLVAARVAVDDAVALCRDADAPAHEATSLIVSARLARVEQDPARAKDALARALAILEPMGHTIGTIDALEAGAGVLADLGRHALATNVLAAATALRDSHRCLWRAPVQQAEHDSVIKVLREWLGVEAFDTAWSEGLAMTVAAACDAVTSRQGERRRPATGWEALTPAESKVAALVAEGLTNPQIGARLFISRHTVDTHLRHVFAKLGVSTRAEVARLTGQQDGADA